MKLLRQLLIILSICLAGEIIHKFILPTVPGNVIGMIILFISLYTGILKLQAIKEISDFLLDHFAFFFLPAGVGLISTFYIFKNNWLPFVVICIVVTILVLAVTGLTIQIMIKRRQNK